MLRSRLPNGLQPVCSVNGKINHILLFYQCPASEDPSLAGQHFSDLIEQIGNDCIVSILVQVSRGTGIRQLQSPSENVRLIVINPDEKHLMHSLTSWVQDVVLTFSYAENKPVLLYDANRVDATAINELCKTYHHLQTFPHNYKNWAGGNILPVVDQQHPFLLVGADIARNTHETNSTGVLPTIEQELRNAFGITKILWPGLSPESGMLNGYQPLFHIDLYLCPLGRLNSNPLVQHILVAELVSETCFGAWTNNAQELADALNRTATWLASAPEGIEFRVIRVPLFAFSNDLRHIGSATNSIVENNNGYCRLLIPDFTPPEPGEGREHNLKKQIQSTQNKMIYELKAAGIDEVELIKGNYFTLAERQGTLHCHTKVVSRNNL